MKITAIIAEYNPFHNGHAYQLNQAKTLTGADYVIAIMSGHFVQRGEPAIYNKWERTHMALKGGIDCVIELPTPFATASAETFALGAMLVVKSLGCIDNLSFGSELGDITPLKKIASLLNNEPPLYKETLRRALKSGHSYPKARQLGVEAIDASLSHHLSGSNNILGIEYLRAMDYLDVPCKPTTIKRIGQSYLDVTHPTELYASATSIRQLLLDSHNASSHNHEVLSTYLPADVYQHILSLHSQGIPPISPSDLFAYYHYLLIQNDKPADTHYYDCPEELMNRLIRIHRDYHSYSAFLDNAQTRNYTKTTIQRALLHMYLQMTETQVNVAKQYTHLPYLHILGFRREASPLLKALKQHALSPLVTNVADAMKKSTQEAMTLLEHEIRYSHLYPHTSKKDDYTYPIIIL